MDDVKIESDNKEIKSSQMNNYVRQSPNAKWFSLFRFPLYIYSASGMDSTKWINRFWRKLGDAPVIYSKDAAQETQQEIEKAVRNMGYMGAVVDLKEEAKGKRMKVSYDIHSGSPYIINNIAYDIADSKIRSYLEADSAQTLLHEGMRFDVNVLDEERQRITQYLQNRGYYRFNKDFITFQADTMLNTHKVDLTGWNDKDNTLLWRKAWADFTNDFLERNGSPERIDHRSNAERGIDEIPTVHMGVAACQMEKKGIATEKGELNRNIQKANRLIREIRAQIGKLKEWIADLFKARETAPEQPPQSPNLANLLMKYLSVQREKSRKYSQRWQQQHTADELKTIAAAVNYLSEHGISNLDELDASLSSVSDKAYSIREGMKTAEQRMKELQKLMEYGRNYQTYKPIQDEYRQIRWKGKQEKFAEARRAELTLWDAANRYLHAHLPEGVKTLPISAWEKEYTALKAQREAEYETLKDTRAEVAELQKIRKCVDIALRADQPEQTQSRTKRQEQER